MKKTIEKLKGGIIRVTTLGERWYVDNTPNPITGLPETFRYAPSVTWIADSYPKGVGYYKWLADKGWEQAESLKMAGGERGSKVHQAIEVLAKGMEVVMQDKFVNPNTEQPEELTLEEWECLVSWCKWFEEYKPVTIATEVSAIAEVNGLLYGCTIDWLGLIDNKFYLCDWKTSQTIWPSSILQVSANAHAVPFLQPEIIEKIKMACNGKIPTPELMLVQVGYKKNKNGYKVNEIDNQFHLFEAAYKIWQNENGNSKPMQREFPIKLKIQLNEHSKQSEPSDGLAGEGDKTIIAVKKPQGGDSDTTNEGGSAKINNKLNKK